MDFKKKVSTTFYQEQVGANEFHPSKIWVHDQDFYESLGKQTFPETIYWFFTGKALEKSKKDIFELCLKFLIHEGGLRHSQTQAALTAAASGVDSNEALAAGIISSTGSTREIGKIMSHIQEAVNGERDWATVNCLGFWWGDKDWRVDILLKNLERCAHIKMLPILSKLLEAREHKKANEQGDLLLTTVIGAILLDLGITSSQFEKLYLLTNGYGIAAHVDEAQRFNYLDYPNYFGTDVQTVDDSKKTITELAQIDEKTMTQQEQQLALMRFNYHKIYTKLGLIKITEKGLRVTVRGKDVLDEIGKSSLAEMLLFTTIGRSTKKMGQLYEAMITSCLYPSNSIHAMRAASFSAGAGSSLASSYAVGNIGFAAKIFGAKPALWSYEQLKEWVSSGQSVEEIAEKVIQKKIVLWGFGRPFGTSNFPDERNLKILSFMEELKIPMGNHLKFVLNLETYLRQKGKKIYANFASVIAGIFLDPPFAVDENEYTVLVSQFGHFPALLNALEVTQMKNRHFLTLACEDIEKVPRFQSKETLFFHPTGSVQKASEVKDPKESPLEDSQTSLPFNKK